MEYFAEVSRLCFTEITKLPTSEFKETTSTRIKIDRSLRNKQIEYVVYIKCPTCKYRLYKETVGNCNELQGFERRGSDGL